MFKVATAKHGLGWPPSDFFAATPRQVWAALDELEHHNELLKEMRDNR